MESREVIVIFGKTGTGKTTYATREIKKHNRTVIVDPKIEYDNGLIFYSFVDLAQFYIDYKPDEFSFICRFDNSVDIESLFKFVEVVEDIFLVVEEAEIYISPYAKQSNFLRLIRYGRHHNISILAIARRASELSTDLKAMTTKIVSFKQTLPLDIKIMESFGIFDVDKLENHEYREIDL